MANDDGITIDRNSSGVVINVLNNDSDADEGDVISIDTVSPASNGTVVNNGDILTYIPNSGFIGTDTFTYTIVDNEGASDTATVTITVNNIAPIAVDDSATTSGRSPVIIFVLDNDNDPDGDVLTISEYSGPQMGSIYMMGDGLEYSADTEFVGTDSFTYTITDADGATSTCLLYTSPSPRD